MRRRPIYDDFFGDDRKQECAHGNYKNCPECDAEGERYLRAQMRDVIIDRAFWFMTGGGFVVFVEFIRSQS